MTTATKIAELNDAFRTTFIGGKIVMTEGVQSLPDNIKSDVLGQVRTFSDFTYDNDPHQEHDFGSIQVDNYKIFWKIDYYDPTFTFGSENPADTTVTRRVLTIMLSDEY